jgi:hypothetical protein
VVNAASATWGFTSADIKDRNGVYAGDPTVMTAFLYLGSADVSNGHIDLTGLTLLATAGQNGDFSFGPTVSDDRVNLPNLASDAGGQAYTLLLVEGADLTTLKDGTSYQMIVSQGESVAMNDPMSGDTWAAFTDGTAYDKDAWKNLEVGPVKEDVGGDNVPEPTSGLLMLIGAAGLALKRKVA